VCRASLTFILTRHSFSVQWFSVRDPPTLHYKDPPGRQIELFPRFLKWGFGGKEQYLYFTSLYLLLKEKLPEMFGMSECHICFCMNVASSWEEEIPYLGYFGMQSSP